MGCVTAGRTTSCTVSCSGGVNAVYVVDQTDVTSVTVDATGATAIVMVMGMVFYKLEFAEQSADFRENLTVETCVTSVEQLLEMIWKCRNQTDRNVIMELAGCCCGLIVIHVEATGTAWIWGHNENQRAFLRTANSQTGKTVSELNQTTVTLGANASAAAIEFVPGEVGIPV